MAIQGAEWILVAVIVVVLILWDPGKIPKIARALGEMKREFEKASQEFQEGLTAAEGEAVEKSTAASDEKLLEVARNLGIETQGKTREEVARAILEKAGVGLNNKGAAERESR